MSDPNEGVTLVLVVATRRSLPLAANAFEA